MASSSRIKNTALLFAVMVAWIVGSSVAKGQFEIRDMCHVKGQETNTLHGIGLVIGLAGTGDPELQVTRDSLAQAMRRLGLNLPGDEANLADPEMLKAVKNTAIVMVTATIPAEGVREGTLIDCEVHAFGEAKSLVGGTLFQTVLTGGPVPSDTSLSPALAIASGKVKVDPSGTLTTGSVENGCKVEVEFRNDFFYYDVPRSAYGGTTPLDQVPKTAMYFDLVIDRGHQSFATAADIAGFINDNPLVNANQERTNREQELYAIAFDQVTIQVLIPNARREDIVAYIGDVLSTAVSTTEPETKVVIDEAKKQIIVGELVTFSRVAVTSGEFMIEGGPFRPLDLSDTQVANADEDQKLKDLVEALNALQAPPETVISIIKQMAANGMLGGTLHIE